jgi:hypothetical protein
MSGVYILENIPLSRSPVGKLKEKEKGKIKVTRAQ